MKTTAPILATLLLFVAVIFLAAQVVKEMQPTIAQVSSVASDIVTIIHKEAQK